jgi:hypothetical protein
MNRLRRELLTDVIFEPEWWQALQRFTKLDL